MTNWSGYYLLYDQICVYLYVYNLMATKGEFETWMS